LLSNFIDEKILKECKTIAISKIGIEPYHNKSSHAGKSISANTFKVKLYDDNDTAPTLISAIASTGNTAAAEHEVPYVSFNTPINVDTSLKYIRIAFSNINETALTGITCGVYDTTTTQYGVYQAASLTSVVSNTEKYNIIKSISYEYDNIEYSINNSINEYHSNSLIGENEDSIFKRTFDNTLSDIA